MIKVLYGNCSYTYVVVCDICQAPILKAEEALAVNPLGMVQGTELEVLHVHKGECDDQANDRLGGESGSIEMRKHLIDLAFNSGLTLAVIAEQLGNEDTFGRLGRL